jgi:hypothetical protein
MILRSTTLFFFLYLFSVNAYSQLISDDSIRDQLIFNYKVKQLDQFFNRFNFKEKVQPINNIQPSRFINILSLLNGKDQALIHNPETLAFIQEVAGDSTNYISYERKDWFSIVECIFIYKGREEKANLILKPVSNALNGFRWVITDAEFSNFDLGVGEDSTYFINPTNHEVGFTGLSEVLSEPVKMSAKVISGTELNHSALLLFLLRNNILKFKQIDHISFQFSIKGYQFIVDEMNRNEINSGWLITKIKPIN